MMNNINLNIELSDPRWNNCLNGLEQISKQVLSTSIDYVKQIEDFDFLDYPKPINISLRLSNDEEIKKLNKAFRNKDKATNVLSFAAIDDENFYSDIEFFDEIELGDIIVSLDTMQKEAKEKNISLKNHYTHLLIHGILHIIGFNHIEDNEADYMEDCEIKILEKLNIANPYME